MNARKGKNKTKNKQNNRPRRKGRATNSVRGSFRGPIFALDAQRITFIYNDTSLIRNNLASQYIWFKMRSSLYDPDPLLLTGGITGFTEWGGIYRQYLIEAVTIEWRVSNLEAFPVSVVFAPSLTDIGSVVSSRNAAADIGELRHSQVRSLSMAGGLDRTMIRARFNLASLVGNTTQFNSGLFSGNMGFAPSNPAFFVYFNFAAYSASNFSSGIESTLKLSFHTKLYSIQSPLDRV